MTDAKEIAESLAVQYRQLAKQSLDEMLEVADVTNEAYRSTKAITFALLAVAAEIESLRQNYVEAHKR